MHAENGHRRSTSSPPSWSPRARPTRTTTAWPATRSSRARRPTASSAWPRPRCARLHRPPLGDARRSTPIRERRDRGAWRSPRPAPSTCSSRSTTWATGFEGAKFVCSPPLRPPDHQDELWNGLRRTTCRSSRPTTARSTSTARRSSVGGLPQDPERPARRRGSRRPDARRWRRRRSFPRSARSRSVDGAGRAVSDVPAAGRDRGRPDADLVVYDPARRHTISATTHHMTSTTVLRRSRR